MTNKIKQICNEHLFIKQHNIDMVYKSNSNLKNYFISTKNKTLDFNKSGIYKVECNDDNCDAVYIGQSARAIKVRLKEHQRATETGKRQLSSAAEHMIDPNHVFSEDNFSLMSAVNDNRQLDALESSHLQKTLRTNTLMNSDLRNCNSILLSTKICIGILQLYFDRALYNLPANWT